MINKVTVILNVFKRIEHFETQIDYIKNQTESCEIWVDCTITDRNSMDKLQNIQRKYPNIKFTIRSNQNLYHRGRFYYALNVQTPYVFIVDDDIFPNKNYIRNCIALMRRLGDCVFTGYGVRFGKNATKYYNPSRKTYGWHSVQNNGSGFSEPVQVDMAGHSWFLKTKYLKYFTYENQIHIDTGEDLHFSYMMQKYAKIPIYASPHILNSPENWSSDPKLATTIGSDSNATFTRSGNTHKREIIFSEQLSNGWKLL